MPEIALHPLWVFKANKAEALLILKALGGRLSDEEKLQAKELGDVLTKQRASVAEDFMRQLVRHANNVET